MMTVRLIAHTPEPEKVVAAAAKLCYSDAHITDLLDGLDEETTAKFLTMLSDLGHASPIEHASFTFGIEGVSRTLLAQITRHRIASFSVQSQRYVRLDDFRYVTPPEIEAIPEAKAAFLASMEEDAQRYLDLAHKLEEGHTARLMAEGMPEKQARAKASKQANEEKKPEEMDVMFLMDRFGYAKTVDMATYERNKEAADTENKYVVKCKNTGRICLFTDIGQLHTIKVTDIPYGKFRDKGIPVDNVSNYSASRETILCVASQTELNLYRMIFVTKQAMMKVVDGGEFDVSKRLVAATKLNEGDEVVSVTVIKEQRNIVLQSKDGYFLKFAIEEIPEKKKGAVGVRGMKLSDKDSIEAVYYIQNAVETAIPYKNKNLVLNTLKPGKRDGKGIKVRA